MRSRTPLIWSSVLYLRRLSTISRVSTMVPSRSRARIEGFSTFSAEDRRATIKPPTPIKSEPKKTTTTRKNRIWVRRFRNRATEFMTKLFHSPAGIEGYATSLTRKQSAHWGQSLVAADAKRRATADGERSGRCLLRGPSFRPMPSPRAYGGRRLASSNMGGGSLPTLVAKQCLRSLGRQV